MKRSPSLLLPHDVSTGTRTRSVSTGSSSSSSNRASKAARKTNSLPTETVEYLKAWMMSPEHIAHPYPTDQEKAQIMADTGIELKQLTNWFVNNRKRFWKPRVESQLQDGTPVAAAGTPPALVTPGQSGKSIVSADGLILKSALLASFSDKKLMKGMITPSSSSSSLSSSPARVSAYVVSETDSVSSEEPTDDEMLALSTSSSSSSSSIDGRSVVAQMERVNVHILRPVAGTGAPTVDDVTVLQNVPRDRVLATYPDCALTYTVPSLALSDSQLIQSLRDSEILKLKRCYLNKYLVCSSPAAKRPRSLRMQGEDDDGAVEAITTPRRKFRRASLQMWREACSSSSSCYDDHGLPSLEEAASLFGFANP